MSDRRVAEENGCSLIRWVGPSSSTILPSIGLSGEKVKRWGGRYVELAPLRVAVKEVDGDEGEEMEGLTVTWRDETRLAN